LRDSAGITPASLGSTPSRATRDSRTLPQAAFSEMFHRIDPDGINPGVLLTTRGLAGHAEKIFITVRNVFAA
jgi:hypothetical protein